MSNAAPVSVIIPVRNGSAHLKTAIDSVRQQMPAAAEVIVIDGDSTDGSAEIASACAGVRVLRQQSKGLAAARNEAIRQCRSPFIAFCDADDRWTEGSLNARLAAIDADPGLSAVIGRLALERLDDTPVTAGQESRLGVLMPGFTPGAMLARREAFETVGWFDESLTIGADSDWFVRLHQSSCTLRVIDAVVLRKGARASSLSGDVVRYRQELMGIARRFIAARRKSRE